MQNATFTSVKNIDGVGMMKKQISLMSAGWMYFVVHFAVEVACFYFLYSRISDSLLWWGLAMLFDALAFVPQSFLGLITDKYPKIRMGLTGCVLILSALIIPWDIVALILLCIGNAMLHIDGAQKTLTHAEGRITPCSIFVGGGSFGLITGQLLGTMRINRLIFIPVVLMIVSAVLVFICDGKVNFSEKKTGFDITAGRSLDFLVLFTFIAVAIRSYIGYAIPTEWKKTAFQSILLFVFMGTGKIMGGVLADKIGYRKTTYISLLLSLPFLLFGNSVMVVSLVGVGLFSMTMPVTVAMLTSCFPKNPCFAFGVTTVALFVGTLPAFFVRPETLLAHQLTALVLSLTALVSIIPCLKKGR